MADGFGFLLCMGACTTGMDGSNAPCTPARQILRPCGCFALQQGRNYRYQGRGRTRNTHTEIWEWKALWSVV
jgi:hypothetical protein